MKLVRYSRDSAFVTNGSEKDNTKKTKNSKRFLLINIAFSSSDSRLKIHRINTLAELHGVRRRYQHLYLILKGLSTDFTANFFTVLAFIIFIVQCATKLRRDLVDFVFRMAKKKL